MRSWFLSLHSSRFGLVVLGATPNSDTASGVVVRHGELNVAIALAGDAPDVRAQVLVGATDTGDTFARVAITSEPTGGFDAVTQVAADQRRLIRISFRGARVYVSGGHVVSTNANSPAAGTP